MPQKQSLLWLTPLPPEIQAKVTPSYCLLHIVLMLSSCHLKKLFQVRKQVRCLWVLSTGQFKSPCFCLWAAPVCVQERHKVRRRWCWHTQWWWQWQCWQTQWWQWQCQWRWSWQTTSVSMSPGGATGISKSITDSVHCLETFSSGKTAVLLGFVQITSPARLPSRTPGVYSRNYWVSVIKNQTKSP